MSTDTGDVGVMKPFMIGIAGPSGSGKSTVCYNLETWFSNVTLFQLDDFYKDAKDCPVIDGVRNWDVPDALDLEGFFSALRSLKIGKETKVPTYRKDLSKRVGSKTIVPKEVVISEGLFLYHHEGARNVFDLRLFLSVPEGVQFQRRSQRQPDFDPGYFHNVVVPAYLKFGEPTKDFAHHILDSTHSAKKVSHDLEEVISRYTLLRKPDGTPPQRAPHPAW